VARRLALVLVVVGLVVAGGVGCGESEEDKFADDYKPLNDALLEEGDDLASVIRRARSLSTQRFLSDFGDVVDRIEQTNRDLKELDPPEDLQTDLSELTGSLDDALRSAEAVETAVREDDVRAARSSTVDMLRNAADVNKAQNALAEATGAEKGNQ
jgi:hypothetical protein